MALPERSMRFTVNGRSRQQELALGISRAIIAGWTGRDAVAVEKHIREMEALGVARPASVPLFYYISTSRLVTEPVIEVIGDQSSGEVEFILAQFGGRLYVGVGSDHTDRGVEAYSVTVSKQMCDKPLAAQLWEFGDVEKHWDKLIIRSWAVTEGRRLLYQEGPVSTMRAPADLIERFTGSSTMPDRTVMFCGTLAALDGVRPAQRFEFEIDDPVLGRRISHGYDVVSLPAIV